MKKISILCIALLSLVACKKTETPAPTPVTTTGTSTGDYALFSSDQRVMLTGTVASSPSGANRAYISNTALINDNFISGSLIDMGSVSLNGTAFQKNALSTPNYYSDSTYSAFSAPFNWVIGGSSAVPSFSFANTTPYPTYTGYTAIADSFVIASGITIPLTNYSGVDEIEIFFYTIAGTTITTNVQELYNQPTSAYFSASDLSTIGSGKMATLVINFYKKNIQVINGKNYNFRTSYVVIKPNIKFK